MGSSWSTRGSVCGGAGEGGHALVCQSGCSNHLPSCITISKRPATARFPAPVHSCSSSSPLLPSPLPALLCTSPRGPVTPYITPPGRTLLQSSACPTPPHPPNCTPCHLITPNTPHHCTHQLVQRHFATLLLPEVLEQVGHHLSVGLGHKHGTVLLLQEGAGPASVCV